MPDPAPKSRSGCWLSPSSSGVDDEYAGVGAWPQAVGRDGVLAGRTLRRVADVGTQAVLAGDGRLRATHRCLGLGRGGDVGQWRVTERGDVGGVGTRAARTQDRALRSGVDGEATRGLRLGPRVAPLDQIANTERAVSAGGTRADRVAARVLQGEARAGERHAALVRDFLDRECTLRLVLEGDHEWRGGAATHGVDGHGLRRGEDHVAWRRGGFGPRVGALVEATDTERAVCGCGPRANDLAGRVGQREGRAREGSTSLAVDLLHGGRAARVDIRRTWRDEVLHVGGERGARARLGPRLLEGLARARRDQLRGVEVDHGFTEQTVARDRGLSGWRGVGLPAGCRADCTRTAQSPRKHADDRGATAAEVVQEQQIAGLAVERIGAL